MYVQAAEWSIGGDEVLRERGGARVQSAAAQGGAGGGGARAVPLPPPRARLLASLATSWPRSR